MKFKKILISEIDLKLAHNKVDVSYKELIEAENKYMNNLKEYIKIKQRLDRIKQNS